MSERCFIIGNGPSLKDTDLELLRNEISFGCNRISKIYPETNWRPSHYVRAEEAGTLDPEVYQNDMDLHINELKCETWANLWFVRRFIQYSRMSNFHTIVGCAHYATDFDKENCPHLWHLPMLCTFGSSVNVAIQIAFREGFSPIYLVGCDLGYKDGKPSHFIKDYEDGMKDKLRPARYANMNTLAAHIVAARSCTVPILNASVGGELEAYERVDYKGLFK